MAPVLWVLLGAATTSMMVGSNTGLIHSGYEGRATGRANGSRDEGFREPRAPLGQQINMGSLDLFFAATLFV